MNEPERLFPRKETPILDDVQEPSSATHRERKRFFVSKKSALLGLVAISSLSAGVISVAGQDDVDTASHMQRDQALTDEAEFADRQERIDQLEAEDAARAERLREAQEARAERANDPHQNTDEVIVLPEEPAIQEHAETFVEVGEEFDINPNYLATLAWIETCGNPESKDSSMGAEGMMQVMPDSADWAIDTYEIDSYEPSKPADSIRVGAAVLALHLISFDNKDYVPGGAIDNYEVQFALYNGGPGQAAPFVTNDLDRSAMVDETEAFVYEADYILNELPADGDNTSCKGNPVIERTAE